ncbi:MAG: hypothetical protein IJ728_06990 [Selenomonadaceae bacterium]|nr:hypothetical protein [Selenomonadaceae bacterium]
MYKNFFKYFSIVLIILINVFSTSTVNAKVKEFIGTGEHYIEDEEETMEDARYKAENLAELNVIEQAEFYLKSITNAEDQKLSEDEIVTITAGLMQVTDIKYEVIQDSSDIFLVKATVTAIIDTEKIPELVEREVQRRSNEK